MPLGLQQAFTLWFPVPPTPFIKGHTWWLGDDDHVAGQADVTGSTALEWDGRALEVVEHVHDGGEVEVLHSALASLGQRQAQVLERRVGSAIEGFERGGGGGTAPPTMPRTLAMPWKLNVSTYSPRRVSLCRTRNTP